MYSILAVWNENMKQVKRNQKTLLCQKNGLRDLFN